MFKNFISRTWMPALTFFMVATCSMFSTSRALGGTVIEFTDPSGDDNGPGTYVYPTDPVYSPGSFDILKFTAEDKGKTVELSVTVRAKLENPWGMASGFSVQMAMVFIDMGHKSGHGHTEGIPGLNVSFFPENAWDKAIIISPQPSSRVKDEINAKAGALGKDIIVPQSITPRGRTFTAVIAKEDLGADISKDWGWQVCMCSNEGFPGAKEILTRRVNEYEGQHRFGGGDDGDCDPHVMDILYPPGLGGKGEVDGQHAVMSKWAKSSDETTCTLAQLPMVYPGKGADSVPKTAAAATTAAAAPAAGQPAVSAQAAKPAAETAAPASAPKPTSVRAGNFGLDISGKIFMNWLWADGTTKEWSDYISPFGGGGHHGTNSEVELNLKAHVSEFVEAGCRLDSRFRFNYWSTYWNNSDLEAAQYMKLRGTWVRMMTPDWIRPALSYVLIGSSDIGMFSPWTVGRIRYIDRDNAAGIFLNGKSGSIFSYDAARIALPSLWAGPGWGTQGKTYLNYGSQTGFMNHDYAYALATNFNFSEQFSMRLLGDYSHDMEGDPNDTDDHNGTKTVTRFNNTIGSLEFKFNPSQSVEVRGMGAYATTDYNDTFDYIANWGGANNMPQKDCKDHAVRLTAEFEDPFKTGLSFSLEYFNIGQDYIALMASRREQDVLLTEGFEGDDVSGVANAYGLNRGYAFDWGGFWGNREQTVSTMPDNNECQFNETAYESVIGWKGGTALVRYGAGNLDLTGEYTMIDYNTNGQNRDMTVYPSSQGIWFANQDRKTSIALLRGKVNLGTTMPSYLLGKIKLIADKDLQSDDTSSDDYKSNKMIYLIGYGFTPVTQLDFELGYTLYADDITLGGDDRSSSKNRVYLTTAYNFGGVKIGYYLEHFWGKDWINDEKFDDFKLTRSRAFLEVAF